MKHPEAGHPIARILDKLQEGQHVLDMRRIQKLQAAEFDEGNVAARQLNFQRATVRRCPEQNRLLLEKCSLLAVRQDLLDDVARLVGFVAYGNEEWKLRRTAFRPEIFGEPLAREAD